MSRMAALTSFSGLSAPGATRSSSKQPAANSISSLRVKPFKAALGPTSRKQLLRAPRVAEAEPAVAEETDLEFSYTESKKGNTWEPSDIENALKYYFEGAGTAPATDALFVQNVFGTEDADFHMDLDNNEGYEQDEFLAAGIPEAAPKRRRKDRGGEEVKEEDESSAEAMDKLKDAEDSMIERAQLEEDFGRQTTRDAGEVVAQGKARMWDWLADPSAQREVSDVVSDAEADRLVSRADKNLPDDSDIMVDLSRVTKDDLPAGDVEVLDLLGFAATDRFTDEDARLLNFDAAEEDDLPEVQDISQEDLDRIDALLAMEVEDIELDEDLVVNVGPIPVESPATQEVLDSYLTYLRQSYNTGIPMSAEEYVAQHKQETGEELVLEPFTLDTKPEDPVTEALLKEAAGIQALEGLTDSDKQFDEVGSRHVRVCVCVCVCRTPGLMRAEAHGDMGRPGRHPH